MNKPEFTVPYNFIPLLSQKSEAYQGQENCSGVIEYTLLTKTPLFIPNSSNDHAFPGHCNDLAHKSYDFFSYDDLSGEKDCENHPHTPVIPGSEMRGVLRSAYEILTNSCMSSLNDQTQMSKRTMESFKPGLILRNEDGTFDLCRAELCITRFKNPVTLQDDMQIYYRNKKDYEQNHKKRHDYSEHFKTVEDITVDSSQINQFKEGEHVSFEYKKRSGNHVSPLARKIEKFKSGNDKADGYVLKGNTFSTKHCLHILCDLGKDPILTDINLKTLEKSLKEYTNNGHPYTEYGKEFREFKNGNGNKYFPVYYSILSDSNSDVDKKTLMLSPAQKTREIYNLKLNDLIGSYGTCKDKKHLCPACDLFGTVIEDNGYARASKIRVTDLQMDDHQDQPYDVVRNLAVLGSPKRNNMEFYLKRPDNAYFWTYEYFIDADGSLHRQKARINGRKFYWHHVPDENRAYLADEKNNNENVTVRPVREGIRFKGKIYFSHISEKQLKQLIWILNCGDNNDIQKHTHGLKLGMAKPLGFGSVSVQVNAVKLRNIVVDSEQKTIRNEDQKYSCKSDDTVFIGNDELIKNLNNFRTASSFDAMKGRTVSYPYNPIIKEEPKGYEWYTWNHGKRILKRPKDPDKPWNPKHIIPGQMPNGRNSMAYVYYMEAMNPDLEETRIKEERNVEKKQVENHDNYGKNNHSHHSNSGDRESHRNYNDDRKKNHNHDQHYDRHH